MSEDHSTRRLNDQPRMLTGPSSEAGAPGGETEMLTVDAAQSMSPGGSRGLIGSQRRPKRSVSNFLHTSRVLGLPHKRSTDSTYGHSLVRASNVTGEKGRVQDAEHYESNIRSLIMTSHDTDCVHAREALKVARDMVPGAILQQKLGYNFHVIATKEHVYLFYMGANGLPILDKLPGTFNGITRISPDKDKNIIVENFDACTSMIEHTKLVIGSVESATVFFKANADELAASIAADKAKQNAANEVEPIVLTPRHTLANNFTADVMLEESEEFEEFEEVVIKRRRPS